MSAVDLNADLGEGVTDDPGLLAVVTSANVACGSHAGDVATMTAVCGEAARRGVAVGAQVSYDDRASFGRARLDVEHAVLRDQVADQVFLLDRIARHAGLRVTYVKPHGALYNTVVHHEEQAAALVAGVRAFGGDLVALGLPSSRWLTLAARAGLRPVPEAFADRAYAADGTLVPRGVAGAVLHDEADVVQRCLRLARDGEVVAADGTVLRVAADSVCVHGDTPGAVRLARAVRSALTAAGVVLAPFADAGSSR